MSRRSRVIVAALVVALGGFALYWFVFRGPTTDAGKLEAWAESACESAHGDPGHRVTAPEDYGGMGRHFFESEYGPDFRRVFDAHGTKIDIIFCEVAGPVVVYMQFDSRGSAARAASLAHRPVCRLPDAVFAGASLDNYCVRLDGTIMERGHVLNALAEHL